MAVGRRTRMEKDILSSYEIKSKPNLRQLHGLQQVAVKFMHSLSDRSHGWLASVAAAIKRPVDKKQ